VTLKEFLVERKSIILGGWLERTLQVYPAASRDFFEKNQDPFSNPIGSTIREGIEKLYREILQPTEAAQARTILTPMIQIRALENLSPSQALAFIPLLKEIIRDTLKGQIWESISPQEWTALNCEIDRLTLQAFDIYLECREKIYRLKIKELKSRSGMIQEEERDPFRKGH